MVNNFTILLLICLYRDLEVSKSAETKLLSKLVKQSMKKGGSDNISRLSELIAQLHGANLLNSNAVEKVRYSLLMLSRSYLLLNLCALLTHCFFSR